MRKMEQYKTINAELITKIQDMKMHIAAYEKQVLYERRLLFEEHQKRIEEQQLLKEKFNKIVKIIKGIHFHGAEIICDSDHSERQSSDKILSNFRRSNIVCNLNTSKITSPPPKHSSIRSLDISKSSMSALTNDSTQSEEQKEEYEYIAENTKTEIYELCSILEENEKGEDNLDENEFISTTSQIILSKLNSNLHNKLKVYEGNPENALNEVRSEMLPQMKRAQMSSNIVFCGSNNEYLIQVPSFVKSAIQITQDDKVLAPPILKKIENNHDVSTGSKENECLKKHLAESDMSWNILDSQRSTPKTSSHKNIAQKTKITSDRTLSANTSCNELNLSSQMLINTSNNAEINTMRPRRQCVPKNLAEPLLTRKLRNDHGKVFVGNRKIDDKENTTAFKNHI